MLESRQLTPSPRPAMWIAYCAMAAALVPLVFMGIGYLLAGGRKRPQR